ncbi:MAG: ErfK/YbiS/YcfS/YnhG family protein, partial [Acidimicrobiales bacterium]|nr:ErfK/YbiS/YcfS/YnhG family protein [Acidimicrobiales bacterium]
HAPVADVLADQLGMVGAVHGDLADATVAAVPLFAAPDLPLAGGPTMTNPTWEGLPLVFLVLREQGDWLDVRVSSRPNGMTAWVRRSDVALRTVPNRVVIEVGARQVSVLHGDQELLRAPVAVGRDNTPTPLGSFFIDGVVPQPGATGAYGVLMLSIAGFSNVLRNFGGGVGQIAMHGTNHPELIGQNVSNGCVRMHNEDIIRVSQLAPLGTPVEIVA